MNEQTINSETGNADSLKSAGRNACISLSMGIISVSLKIFGLLILLFGGYLLEKEVL
jgi:hypothetical protein